MRACAAGAAVVAVAGTGGATAMAAAALTIPVPCRVSALENAIRHAPPNAILVLQAGCTYRIRNSLPDVTSNLTIEGSGDTITRSGDGNFTALENSAAQLTISRLTFSDFRTGIDTTAGALINDNGSDTTPGALINDGGTVTIIGSAFLGNAGGDDGGAILNESGGILNVSSTLFRSNVSGTVTLGSGSRPEVSGDKEVDGYGGAISNEDSSTATLTADTFFRNAATYGGAIYVGGGTVTVTGPSTSAFTDNAARDGYGGAIYNESGTLVVSYASFTDNYAGTYGGAIETDHGSGSVSDSSFTRNASDEYGGALEDDTTALSLTGDTFTRNDGEYGGAIETEDTALSLTNDVLTGNTADDGGGIIVYGGQVTLGKTLVVGNRADDDGGGIYRSSGSVRLTDGSIVRGNSPDNCYRFSC